MHVFHLDDEFVVKIIGINGRNLTLRNISKFHSHVIFFFF